VAKCCREDLLVANESWRDWRSFAIEELKNLESTRWSGVCERVEYEWSVIKTTHNKTSNVRKRNVEVRWRTCCCRRKAIGNNWIHRVRVCSLSYPACKAHEWYCGLGGCTMFFHITSQMSRFSGKKVIEHKMCLDFPYNFCLEQFSFYDVFSQIVP